MNLNEIATNLPSRPPNSLKALAYLLTRLREGWYGKIEFEVADGTVVLMTEMQRTKP